jgi:hypothetical protein
MKFLLAAVLFVSVVSSIEGALVGWEVLAADNGTAYMVQVDPVTGDVDNYLLLHNIGVANNPAFNGSMYLVIRNLQYKYGPITNQS